MTSGGTDASRESVDATHTRDPAPEARGRRQRPADRAVPESGAQHRRGDLAARGGGRAMLAAAGDADRPRAGADAVCGPRQSARRAAQGGARLGLRSSRAAPARRHADAAVGGVPAARAGRLCLQPLVRAVPRLGGPAVADDAAGPSRRRADVRRLRRPDRRSDRPRHRRGPAGAGLRRGDGRLQLHLRRGDADPEPAGLDRGACPCACLHGRRAGTAGARQPEGRGRPRQLVRARAQPDLSRPGDALPHGDPADPHAQAAYKAKVEVAVLVVERWILARLRNRRFFSLAELNRAIAELVTDLNARPMRRLGVSRRDLFCELDRPALKPLPAEPYEYAEWRMRRVGLDYHVDIDGHYYSVPHRLIREQLDARITERTIELFCRGERVAVHMRTGGRGRHTMIPEHTPSAHRRYAEWTIERIRADATAIGTSTAKLVALILESRPHPEQGYRASIGILRLARHYGADRLEAACERGLDIGARSYGSVQSILKHGLDRRPPPRPARQGELLPDHPNIRGPRYYH